MKLTLPLDTPLSEDLVRKILQMNAAERGRIEELYDYYRGKTKILRRTVADPTKPNNKIVNPFPAYITNTLSGYFMGEPITYKSEDEAQIDELNMIVSYNDGSFVDMELARGASICGTSFELHYVDEEGQPRFVQVNPLEVIPVYDDTIENNLLYVIRVIPQFNIAKQQDYFDVYIYDDKTIKHYKSGVALTSFELLDEMPHFYGEVPWVIYHNNNEDLGDFELVKSLIDAYDSIESDTLNDFEAFVDAYLVLKGMTADADDIAQMKENRTLLLDNDADADWLIKQESGNTVEDMKNRIVSDIHKFSCCPDLTDKEFAGNASGVAIKYKLIGTEDVVSTKERYFKKGIQRRLELITNILNLKGNSYDYRAIEVVFTRALPTNETEIADTINKLSGIVSTETLLSLLPFVEDVEAEMNRLEEQKERNPFYNLPLEMNEEDEENEDETA